MGILQFIRHTNSSKFNKVGKDVFVFLVFNKAFNFSFKVIGLIDVNFNSECNNLKYIYYFC